MTPRRTRSKKPSAASSRPEVVFLIDECLGKVAVPEAMRSLGATVCLHGDLFARGTEDAVWLRALAARPEIAVLTKDKQIRKRTLEHDTVIEGRVRLFTLTAGGLSGAEQANSFRRAYRRILRCCRAPGPFIAAVTATGRVRVIVDARRAVRRARRRRPGP